MNPVLNPLFLVAIRGKVKELGHDLTPEQIKAVFEAMIWAQQKLVEYKR